MKKEYNLIDLFEISLQNNLFEGKNEVLNSREFFEL